MTTATKRQTKKVLTGITEKDAQQAAQSWAKNHLALETLQAKMNEAIKKVKDTYEPKINMHTENLEQPSEVLEAYAKENKAKWVNKSFEFLNVRIGFNTCPKSVADKTKGVWESLAEKMSKLVKFKPFVRVKYEINKKTILAADEKLLKELKSKFDISIEQPEKFFIEGKKEVLKKK